MCRWNFFALLLVSLLVNCLKQAQAIIGGKEATNGGYSFTVALKRNGKVHCSGSIIGKNSVVTAAHCVYNDKDSAFTVSPLQVIANALKYNDLGPRAVVVDVDAIHIPKKYLSSSKEAARVGDIAVLKLHQELDLSVSSGITKLFLPEDDFKLFNTEIACHFAGYGWDWFVKKPNPDGLHTTIGGGSSGKLRTALMRITNLHDCRFMFGLRFEVNKHLCARMDRLTPSDGVLYGDDGGPLIYDKDILLGVLSMYNTKFSDIMMPAVYTRVETFRKFLINAKLDIETPITTLRIKLLRQPDENQI